MLVVYERSIFAHQYGLAFESSCRDFPGKNVGKRIRRIRFRFSEKRDERDAFDIEGNGSERVHDVFSVAVFSCGRRIPDHGPIRRDGEGFRGFSTGYLSVGRNLRNDVLIEEHVDHSPCRSGIRREGQYALSAVLHSDFGGDYDVATVFERLGERGFVGRTIRENHVDTDGGRPVVTKFAYEIHERSFRKIQNAEIGFLQFVQRRVVDFHDCHFSRRFAPKHLVEKEKVEVVPHRAGKRAMREERDEEGRRPYYEKVRCFFHEAYL